jgi:hypothetical protein
MAFFDRFKIRAVVAGAGLCATSIALSPAVYAAPMTTEYECAAGAPAGKECVAPAAAFAPMAGVPMALPGPVPVRPAAPPLPVVPAAPPVPVIPAAPVVPAAPVAGGAPVTMAGGFAGKGDPIVPAPAGAPVPGQPIPAGPSAAG